MGRRNSVAIAYDCLFPYTTGGGERLYRGIAERMVDAGLRVDYLTAKQWDERPAPERFSIVGVTGALRLYDGDGVRRTPAALAFAAGLFRSLVKRRRSYDAVFVSGLPVLNVFAARAALIGSHTRLIVDYLEVWGYRQWVEYAGRLTGTIAWALQRVAVALTPTATCHSQLTARRLRAEGLRRAPLVSPGLIDSPVDGSFIADPASPPFVLYAGRHIGDKRVEVLPAAVAHARRTIPDLRLVILGKGSTTPQIDAAVAAVGGGDWTEMPGFVDEDRLRELMGSAACLANPSRREGYGLVVVESASYGTPVVLVDDEDNAAVELVDPDVNGVVAASTDAEILGAAIARVVDEGGALRSSTRAWYEDAVRTRTIDLTVTGIVDAIYAADGAPGTPPAARDTTPPREGTP